MSAFKYIKLIEFSGSMHQENDQFGTRITPNLAEKIILHC